MSLIAGAANAYFTYKFLRLLTQKWEDTDAFKLGLVDGKGKKLRSPQNQEEKAAYSLFNRLAFNLKRILSKAPGGSSRLASYAAALYLIKEHTDAADTDLEALSEALDLPFDFMIQPINESYIIDENNQLAPGSYTLTSDIGSLLSGEVVGRRGHTVLVGDQLPPVDYVMGVPIYEAVHKLSKQKIYITVEDIRR